MIDIEDAPARSRATRSSDSRNGLDARRLQRQLDRTDRVADQLCREPRLPRVSAPVPAAVHERRRSISVRTRRHVAVGRRVARHARHHVQSVAIDGSLPRSPDASSTAPRCHRRRIGEVCQQLRVHAAIRPAAVLAWQASHWPRPVRYMTRIRPGEHKIAGPFSRRSHRLMRSRWLMSLLVVALATALGVRCPLNNRRARRRGSVAAADEAVVVDSTCHRC